MGAGGTEEPVGERAASCHVAGERPRARVEARRRERREGRSRDAGGRRCCCCFVSTLGRYGAGGAPRGAGCLAALPRFPSAPRLAWGIVGPPPPPSPLTLSVLRRPLRVLPPPPPPHPFSPSPSQRRGPTAAFVRGRRGPAVPQCCRWGEARPGRASRLCPTFAGALPTARCSQSCGLPRTAGPRCGQQGGGGPALRCAASRLPRGRPMSRPLRSGWGAAASSAVCGVGEGVCGTPSV